MVSHNDLAEQIVRNLLGPAGDQAQSLPPQVQFNPPPSPHPKNRLPRSLRKRKTMASLKDKMSKQMTPLPRTNHLRARSLMTYRSPSQYTASSCPGWFVRCRSHLKHNYSPC